MAKKTKSKKIQGFTVLELLLVASIIGVLATISYAAWYSYYPIFRLDQAASQIAADLNWAAYQAASRQNNWMAFIIYPRASAPGVQSVDLKLYDQSPYENASYWVPVNSYLLINDDGWLGTAQDGIRRYKLGSPDFFWPNRNSGQFDLNELSRGPIRLGKGLRYIRGAVTSPGGPYYNPQLIIFYPNRTVSCKDFRAHPHMRPRTSGVFWLGDQYYVSGDASEDNKVHLREINIRNNAKVTVSRSPSFVP